MPPLPGHGGWRAAGSGARALAPAATALAAAATMAAVLLAAYPASPRAQTANSPEDRDRERYEAVAEFSKPTITSAETVQGSTTRIRLEWQDNPNLAEALAQANDGVPEERHIGKTGFCYIVHYHSAGVALSGRKDCRTSDDSFVEFDVPAGYELVEIWVGLRFGDYAGADSGVLDGGSGDT